MAEVISLMDIDEDDNHQKQNHSQKLSKGKRVVTATDIKAIPSLDREVPPSVPCGLDRLTSENRLPHLLLYGPPGTGKTSTILAVARKLYGAQYHNMILELNASNDRGIDVVRQQIQDFASTQCFSFGAKSSVKLILLDEADAMTKDAQFALRRVIEKYAKNTRFALIYNHVNKIIPALQSRCIQFRFSPLDPIHVTERLKHVIEAEGLDVSDSSLTALVRLSNGDMRKALNILHVFRSPTHILLLHTMVCVIMVLVRNVSQKTAGISEIKTRKGLALIDIVREVTMFVFKIKMPTDVRVQLINDLADIEGSTVVATAKHTSYVSANSNIELNQNIIRIKRKDNQMREI
ncbi:hypothetical protein CRYUN_Cryun30bG0072800 [Craigia yunnanensis]